MNNYIVFLILSLITIFLLKKLLEQNEQFSVNESEFQSYQTALKRKDENRLKVIKDDSSLFAQFCNKIKYFDDNYDSSSKIKMFTKYSKQNIIKKLKKKQDKLLKETFDLQEKIYNNKDDIEYHKNYEDLIDDKTKQYIQVLDKAIENIKENINITPKIEY
jgi:hypothetical protein|tara:strand:- start:2309 stop:2791 length:483 start_codon:yes stop_codon:yes gene_type:complete